MTNLEKLKKTFASALDVRLSVITDTLYYQSIPEWDSVSHMILINEIEEAFDVIIDTDDVIYLSSIGKAKEILEKNKIKF